MPRRAVLNDQPTVARIRREVLGHVQLDLAQYFFGDEDLFARDPKVSSGICLVAVCVQLTAQLLHHFLQLEHSLSQRCSRLWRSYVEYWIVVLAIYVGALAVGAWFGFVAANLSLAARSTWLLVWHRHCVR